MMKTAVLMCCFLLFSAGALFSQTPAPTPTPAPPKPVPEPYAPEEFAGWVLSLRRAEIIFFGSLPFSFLIATEGVEIGRFFANGQDPAYRPFPFRAGIGVPYTAQEQLIIIGSTCAVSLVVAIIDFIINESIRSHSHAPSPP